MTPLGASVTRNAARAAAGRVPGVPRWVRFVAPMVWRRERAVPNPLLRADLYLFRRVARMETPVLDRTLPPLTRAANHSRLWMAIAVALGALGGRFGRRAGLRGLFSVGLASAVANLPAKMIARRRRPVLDDVPLIRRLARLPASSSFPSGHSASAFAFATAASIEKPAIAPALLPLAGAVAFSRVYTGVHYPSDVLAGAALGAGVAAATRRWWPVAPHGPATAKPVLHHLEDRPSSAGEGLTVVVNPGAGGPLGPDTTQVLRDALPKAEIVEVPDGADLREALEEAASEAAVVGIAGGDGSVNVAAEVALAHGKPLFVVPAGTLNNFAGSLGLNTVTEAVDALRAGHVVQVDVGTVDDSIFLNTTSFGAYVDLVDARERLQHRIGKWPAVLVALVRVLRRSQPIQVEIDGKRVSVWLFFCGNGIYRPAGLAPGWRDRLDDGKLDVRYVDGSAPGARVRLITSILTGTLARSQVYVCLEGRTKLHICSMDGPLRLARDGETFDGGRSFTIGKSPERLTVYAPRGGSA